MIKKIKIGNKFIGEKEPVFIIAEAGVNHNGKLAAALKLIDAAAAAGVDAVKFQTFRAENVTTGAGEMAEYQKKNIGKNESQLMMLKKLELPEDFYPSLINRCREKKIIFLSAPHGGFQSVDFLENLKIPAFKIGSSDLTNLPLLEYAAKFNKPMIISTGMATLAEARQATEVVKKAGNNNIIVLHCTVNYPCPLNEVNLRAMAKLEKELKVFVGYSDHTEGIKISIAAVVLGARLIEKHFTLDKNLPGPDHKASLEPAELSELVRQIRKAEKRLAGGENPKSLIKELKVQPSLGSGIKKPFPSELKTMKIGRKSLVARLNISKGTEILGEMLDIKRPGTGLEPKYLKMVVGKIARKNILRDALITFKDLK